MVEIRNPEELRAWLEGKSREASVAIACRAALRSAPFLSRLIGHNIEGRRFDDDLTSWLRCILTSGVAGTCPTPEVRQAADAAYAASAAAAAAAYAAADAAAFWTALSSDITLLDDGMEIRLLMQHPIWPEGAPDELTEPTQAFLSYLSSKPELSFWARWYERMAKGDPPNWEMQTEIVLIEDVEWRKGAARVAELIGEIEGKYAGKALPLAEEIRLDETGKLVSVPLPMRDNALYETTLEAVDDALADAMKGENNALRPDGLEAGILARSLDKYRDKPFRVHQDFTIVCDNLMQKLADGVFPEDHPPIVNLLRVLDDGAVNIRVAIPEVRETVAAMAARRFDEATEEEKAGLLAGAELMEADASEDFAGQIEEDRNEIATPEDERTLAAALYRTMSRMTKVQKIVYGGAAGLTAIMGAVVTWEAAIKIILGLL